MSEDNHTTALEEVVQLSTEDVGLYTKSVSDLREDFGHTVSEIKQKFTLLLDLRDQRIKDLEGRIGLEKQEKPNACLLVLDDAQSTTDLLERYLAALPIDVIHVPGDQAHDRFAADDHATIMIEAACSIEPGVDGLSLCRQLCEEGKGDRVIIMSSRPGDTVKKSTEQAGAFFIRKPFRREQLAKIIKETIFIKES